MPFNEQEFMGVVKVQEGFGARGVIKKYTIPYHGFEDLTYNRFKDKMFSFADPINTPREINFDGTLNKVLIMNENMILTQLAEVVRSPYESKDGKIQKGAFDKHLSAIWSLKEGSTGWDGPFDYSTKNFFQERKSYIFVTDDNIQIVGHDYRNMGNFLWGAATYILGVPERVALSGAHLNNLIFESESSLDSPDDQYSIKLGRYYAKQKGWKKLAGKGNENILKNE